MYLALDELLKTTKKLRKLLLKIKGELPGEVIFDRLLLLVCMGKGGFLPLVMLPNHKVMNLICESSELFEEIFPYIDQQFLYQCMDDSAKSEILQCVSTVQLISVSKTVQKEHYFKALTILYQVLYEIIIPNDDLWEEFTYRLVAHWNNNDKHFVHASQY